MSHESVWNSRPRTYGKGARAWYVFSCPYTLRCRRAVGQKYCATANIPAAESAHTRLVLFENTVSISAVNASARRPLISDLSRYALPIFHLVLKAVDLTVFLVAPLIHFQQFRSTLANVLRVCETRGFEGFFTLHGVWGFD